MPKVGPRPANSFLRPRPTPEILVSSGKNARTIFLRPWLLTVFGTIGVVFLALYLAATGYLVFRDDLLSASVARQARIQNAYEDRIAFLRTDIDRLTSRHLLNQQAFDEKLELLLTRQAALDARQDIIAGLSQAVRRTGLAPSNASVLQPNDDYVAPSDRAASDSVVTGGIEPLKAGQRAILAIAQLRPTLGGEPVVTAPEAKIAAIELSLEALANEQVAFVKHVADRVGQQTDLILATLNKIGHRRARRAVTPNQPSGVGGPFLGIASSADPETFRDGVAIVTAEIERLSVAKVTAGKLPLAEPLASSALTSRFGQRIDPILQRPAFHTGVDYRATKGYPVRTTAAGKVIFAKFNGGYGKVVEIDHGNGITTRYGHLSQFSVKVGDTVAKDDIIGGAGSTGRSTGPHLHYEVRVGGKPTDPMRYIRAGNDIIPLL